MPRKSEDEGRKFWAAADSTQYANWPSGKREKFVNLKASLRAISIRLPKPMSEDLKTLANQRDAPYQSLLKVFLAQPRAQERRARTH